MSVRSPFLINSFSSFLLITYQVFCSTDLKCFWLFSCKKLPSVRSKLNSAIDVWTELEFGKFKIY